jgi:hypothetical protein
VIQPELERVCGGCVQGLSALEPHGYEDVPAAGHLGVIEEKCSTPHADEKRPGLNLLRRVGGWVCPTCGATA